MSQSMCVMWSSCGWLVALAAFVLIVSLPFARARPQYLEWDKDAEEHSHSRLPTKRLSSHPLASERIRHPLPVGVAHFFSRRTTTDEADLCPQDSTNEKTRVCRNCAKITRASGAFAGCCSNAANAFSWCKRLFDFATLG